MQKVNSTSSLKTFISGSCAFSLSLYIFCAHFNYPFSQTLFLYIGVLLAGALLVSDFRIPFNKTIKKYICIIIITALGCLYSNDVILAKRQLVFFSIYGVILCWAIKNQKFVIISRKIMYIFALIGISSVYIQFIIPIPFNLIIQRLFRAKVYENILWSYKVDGSFTGLTPSVSMASFSMAIVFFVSSDKVLKKFFVVKEKDNNGKSKSDFCALFFMIFSVIGIILTNKRGIFLAVVLAFLLSIMLDKNIAIKKLSRKKLIILMMFILTILLFGSYFFSTSEQVAHFLARFQNSSKGLLTGRDVYYEKAVSDFASGGIFTLLFGRGTASAYLINNTGIHNVYLQILYDHGLIGIVFYFSFFVSNLRKAIKNRYFFSMSLQMVFLIYCMTGNPLYDYFFFIPYLLNSQYRG